MANSPGRVDEQIARVEKLKAHGGVDGLHMTSDYCLNTGPFLSPRLSIALSCPI